MYISIFAFFGQTKQMSSFHLRILRYPVKAWSVALIKGRRVTNAFLPWLPFGLRILTQKPRFKLSPPVYFGADFVSVVGSEPRNGINDKSYFCHALIYKVFDNIRKQDRFSWFVSLSFVNFTNVFSKSWFQMESNEIILLKHRKHIYILLNVNPSNLLFYTLPISLYPLEFHLFITSSPYVPTEALGAYTK